MDDFIYTAWGDVMYVYVLCDPDTLEVRYVGCTRYPEQRLVQHCQSPLKSTREWIKELKSHGKRPVMQIVQRTRRSCALNIERIVILGYRRLLGDRLLNQEGLCLYPCDMPHVTRLRRQILQASR